MWKSHWWVAAALVAAPGCADFSGNNPNEANFPGAPGSSVPAPPQSKDAESAGPPMGGAGSMPSSYPGRDALKKADEPAPKDKAEAAKPDEAKPKTEEPAATPKEAVDAKPKTEAPAAKEAPAPAPK